jgi:transposase
MRDKDLYAQILGIKSPWQVSSVELALSDGEVTVHVEREAGATLCCPSCGQVSPGYDSRLRRWRRLDTCQYKTILVADVPRVKCTEHGVVTVSVPWAEPGSGYTAMFEALVIDWLKEASISAVSRLMGLSWNAIDGIMQRAVRRGLSCRQELSPMQIGVDETAFRKRHEYVTIVSDQKEGTVLYVGEERNKATLKAWYASLRQAQREAIESVSMDMLPVFINAALESLPEAEEKNAFDKFHVAKYLGEAVDKVCRQEHKALMSEGYEDLKGSKYDWLYNPDNMSRKQNRRYKALRDSTLKTASAWAIKELAMSLWHYVSKTWARKGWEQWLNWAVRSRLDPIREVAKTIKIRSRGFRNKERFANAIYFYLGGLDLYPAGVAR